jgi:Holliday junction DNA helicase RuvA
MISNLMGVVRVITDNKHITVLTGSGVGYEVRCPYEIKSPTINLYIHCDVRENAIDLYGFKSQAEVNMFRKLIKIQGLGPKTSLIIMGTHTITNILKAIADQNLSFFEKISGIGHKTAQNIINNFK